MVWLLIAWDVPRDRQNYVYRIEFRPTRKNPDHWWRVFDPAQDAGLARSQAREAVAELRRLGLRYKWSEVERKQRPSTGRGSSRSKPWVPAKAPWSFPTHRGVTARPRWGDRGHRRGARRF